MNDATYTDRHIEIVTINRVHGDGRTVTWDNGWSFGGIPAQHRGHVVVGATFAVETIRLTQVTGLATLDANGGIGKWLWHKTDDDLAREHAEMVAGFQREREEQWEAHREAWTEREARLPLTLRRRLERFRANGGHDFETNGWGYELVISELAVLYAASGQEDTADVMAYANEHGTSGNQHDMAKVLSRGLTNDPADQDAVANAPSGRSPLTGDFDYSKAGS
jgi:hypothetical protein